jgi:hypothetical protein
MEKKDTTTAKDATTKATEKASASDRPLTATSGFPVTTEDPVMESARRGEARASAAALKDTASDRSRATEEAERVEKAKRSGGPLHADPTKPPLNSKGEEQTHPPDLADNPPDKRAANHGAFGGFPPREITSFEDLDDVFEKIRTAEKADVLYAWKAQEKAAEKPRQEVIDAINARLLHVQGPPLPPD